MDQTSYDDWKAAALREMSAVSLEDQTRPGILPLTVSLSAADANLASQAHALICEPRPPVDSTRVPPVSAKFDEAASRCGLSPTLELAILLGSAEAQLKAPAENVTFHVSIGGDVWTEVAKLRALRLGWAKLQSARGRTPVWAHLISIGNSPSLTLKEPWVNLLRNAHLVFASIVGGADDIVIAPFDYGYDPHSDLGQRMVFNARRVLEDEGLLTKVKDPTHGSFAVESLTCSLLRGAWSWLERIEDAGGYSAFVSSGALETCVEADFAARRKAFAEQRLQLTGVTRFVDRDPESANGYPRGILGSANRDRLRWNDEFRFVGGER